MDLQILHEFVEFCQYMNVTQAAKHLHIAQPTLSNHLAMLQKELGIELIAHEKPLALTSAGRVFLAHAVNVLAEFDKAVDAARSASEQNYSIRVFSSGGPYCGESSFRMLTNRFLLSEPAFSINTVFSREETVAEILQDRSIDCALAYICPLQQDIDAGIAFVELPEYYPNRQGLWLERNSILASKKSLKWSDCNGLMFPVSINVPLWINAVRETLRVHNVQFDYRILSGASINQNVMVGPSDALLLDQFAANSDVYSGFDNKVFVPLDEPDAFVRTYLAYRPDRVSPALQHFLDYIQTQIKQ